MITEIRNLVDTIENDPNRTPIPKAVIHGVTMFYFFSGLLKKKYDIFFNSSSTKVIKTEIMTEKTKNKIRLLICLENEKICC